MSQVDKQRFRGKRLLILDDSPEQLAKFVRCYQAYGFEVRGVLAINKPNGHPNLFYDRESLLRAVKAFAPNLVLTDGAMAGSKDVNSGERATRAIKDAMPEIPVIMHTGAVEEAARSPKYSAREVMAEKARTMQEVGGLAAFGKSEHYVPAILDEFEQALAQQRQR